MLIKKEANLNHTMIIMASQHSDIEEEGVVDGMRTKGSNHKHGGKRTPMPTEMKKVVMVKQQRERLPSTEGEHEDTEEVAIEGEETEVVEENLEDEVSEAEVIEVVAAVVAVAEVEDIIKR